MGKRRAPKHVALKLLGRSGERVEVLEYDFVTDSEGSPLAFDSQRSTASLTTTPDMLGWTQEELDDPNVVE